MKAAIGLWVGNEVGRRWRALVALGALAGLVGGLGIAAVAGARRTSTAYERFREATGRSDAIVFASLVGVIDADYAPVRNLPEVEDAGEFVFAPVGIKEFPGSAGALHPGDDRLFQTVNRPLVVSGRLPDPERTDEVLMNRQAAKMFDLKVGDRLTLVSALEFPENEDDPVEGGPSNPATIVGIGDSNMDLVFYGDEPGYVISAGFLAAHPEIPRGGNLVVRLRPGTDVSAFRARVAEVIGLPNIPVRDQSEDTKRITHGTDIERTALLLFAGAVALAGIVLVGQAMTRTVYAMAQPAPALRALGFTRNALVAGLVLPLSIAAGTGALMALGAAIAISPWFPVGLAGRLDPDPGLHADWLVIVPGAIVVALATLAGATGSALRATTVSRRRVPTTTRFSLVPTIRRMAGAPLPAVIGASLALERGDGERSLPVRPALAGAVAAVVGVVGAFGLLQGIDDALARPGLAGQFWDADVRPGEDVAEEDIVAAVSGDERITDINVLRLTDVDFDGVSVPIYALDPRQGDRSYTLLEGRRPAASDEVVIGPLTAKALGKGIGDTVRIQGPEGTPARIVGLGLLPQTPHFSFDQGAWMSVDGFEAVAPPIGDGSREVTVLVRFAPGVSVDEGIAALEEPLGPGVEIEPSALPQDVAYLRNVRTLPKALAAFLVFLGLGALSHVLATAVRRRRHDLAVLRALGFRPVQVAGCVAWQAVTVALVALLIGIPLGIAAGRWSWRWVADSTPLLYVPPLAAFVALASIPAALLLANAMAVLPARRAALLRPADVLRTE
jgi:ABC-type lipoprotein release transport system permease subunit